LVAASVLAVLLSLLVPAVGGAMGGGRDAACLSNLRQLGAGLSLFAAENGKLPPAWVDSESRWMDLVKPYLPKSSGVYVCPSDPEKIPLQWDDSIAMSYGMNAFNLGGNPRTCFWYGVRPSDVARPSRTILLADCTPGKYYCGGGNRFADPVYDVDYRHRGESFNALFCDGHAENRTRTGRPDWDASQ
jgi:prepilin-type processing-associated H-X9-DG protein